MLKKFLGLSLFGLSSSITTGVSVNPLPTYSTFPLKDKDRKIVDGMKQVNIFEWKYAIGSF